MNTVRALAVRVLREAERKGLFVDEVLDNVRDPSLAARDRAFLTHLVYGTTRHRRTLDYLLRKISGVQRCDPQVQAVLHVALYEIHFLGSAVHAAVDEAVTVARRVSRKSGHFVNAVLRKATRVDREALLPDHDLSLRYSYPPWLVQRWKQAFGNQTEELLAAGNRILPITARVNRLRASRESLEFPRGRHPDSVVLEGPIGTLDAIVQGDVSVQDETAMRVAPLLEPAGKRIVDLCASPGGKTTHLAELGGHVVAVDVTRRKLRRVLENTRRVGVAVLAVVADGRRFSGRFDGVLLDAPCTNTGVLMRRPDARWRLRPDDFPRAALLQDQLLSNAATLAPLIVYSTCSIEAEENEDRIEAFLAAHPQWTCDHRERTLPGETSAGGFSARLRRLRYTPRGHNLSFSKETRKPGEVRV